MYTMILNPLERMITKLKKVAKENYFMWVIPFLVLTPNPALMLLVPLLSLYYLRFYFEELGLVGWFDYGVVWLEYVPVLVVLGYMWARRKRAPATL